MGCEMREETGWESRNKGISFPSTPHPTSPPSQPQASPTCGYSFQQDFIKYPCHIIFWSLDGISVCPSAPGDILLILAPKTRWCSWGPAAHGEGGTDTGHCQHPQICHTHTQAVPLPCLHAGNHRVQDKLLYNCQVFRHRAEGDSM